MPGFAVCGPNEVIVVSGCFKSRPSIVHGRTFVLPGLQKLQRLSVSTMTLKPTLKNQHTSDRIPINVTVVLQVRISPQNEQLLNAALENFLSKTEEEMKNLILGMSTGFISTVIGEITAENIKNDVKGFNKELFEYIATEFVYLGLLVVSITATDITDDQGYYKQLALKKIEQAVKEQEEKGNLNSHVVKYSNKLKEFEAGIESGSIPSSPTENSDASNIKDVNLDLENNQDKEAKGAESLSQNNDDLYKAYDWSSEREAEKKSLIS